MRRFIALFFAILVLMATLSFSSFAETPSGNLSVQFQVWEYLTLYGTEVPKLIFDNYTGNTFIYGIRGIDRDSNSQPIYVNTDKQYNLVSFTLSGTATIWIACRTDVLSSYDFSYLAPYRYSSGDLTHSYSDVSYDQYSFWWDSKELIKDSSRLESFNVTYLCFKDVPCQSFSYLDNSTGTDPQHYIYRVSGIYINRAGGGSVSDIFNDYLSGNISFSDAVSSVRDITNTNVSQSQSNDEKIFHLLNGDFILDQLRQASDDSFMAGLGSSFVSPLNDEIKKFRVGHTTLINAVGKMSSLYNSALSSAETVDQGLMISSIYSNKLTQLRFTAEAEANKKMDSAISDAEMQEMADYYSSEDNLLAQFDIQQFKDALTFDLWFQQLDLVESNSYKSIFDYIINESPIKLYITIPLALLIVSILLGTRLRSSSHKSGDSS